MSNDSMEPFRSDAEMTAAMQDERYAKDPAYRKDVQDRISVRVEGVGDNAATSNDGEPLSGEAFVKAVHAAAGGPAQFALAQSRITDPDTRARWNDAVDAGDLRTIRTILGATKESYSPTAPRTALTTPTSITGGFRSNAEMVAAIRDPRYRKDPAYRKDVEDRIAATGEK